MDLDQRVIMGHKHSYKGAKAFLKRQETMFIEMLVNFHPPGSGSAFPIRIWIQDSQMNADPCGSGSTILLQRLCRLLLIFKSLRGSILNFIEIQAEKKPRSEQKTSYSNLQVIFLSTMLNFSLMNPQVDSDLCSSFFF